MGEVSLQLYPTADSSGDVDVGFAPTGVNVYNESERACSQLTFNPIHSDLLACGFDYKEGMPSLHIYDITRNTDVRQLLGTRSTPWSTYSESTDIQHQGMPLSTVDAVCTNTMAGKRIASRPQSAASSNIASNERDGEYGPMHSSSGVTSLSWVPNSVDDILVASRKNRSSIRWYDLRMRYAGETVLYVPMPNANGSGYPTPGTVYDLQFDPFNSYRYMAHDRHGFVNMWDIRCASRPLYSFSMGTDRSIVRVAYSPRRSGMVAALAANSTVLDIYSISEFPEGRVVEAKPLDATSFLDDARMKDHYEDYRSAAVSEVELQDVHVWMDHTNATTSICGETEADSAFLWVPPSVSSKTLTRQQLIVCTDNGIVCSSSLPTKLVADFSGRGDVAISNNWIKLLGVDPKTDADMEMIHLQTSEFRELILDKRGRHSSTGNTTMSNTTTTGGGVGGMASAAPATPGLVGTSVGPTAHASIVNIASTGTAYQSQSQSEIQGSSSLLARRQQAARQQVAGTQNTNVAQLGERIKAMSLGFSTGNSASSNMVKNSASPLLSEYLENDRVRFNPAFDGRVEGDERVESVLADDILSQMRQRVLLGYGSNAEKNARIFNHDQKTRDMWQWVRDGDIRRRSGEYHVALGTDASFYGVYGIMNLSKKQLRYMAKQNQQISLDLRSGNQQRRQSSSTVIRTRTKLNGQRRLALLCCGWGLEGSIREQHIYALEAAKEFSVAAGASFIYGDHQRCLQSLERSNSQDQKLLSFMLKAQINENNSLVGGNASEETSAPKDMFGCPHLQMIFTYLVTGDWNQVVRSMDGMPLSYRLAVALRYMSDEALMRFIVAAGQTAARNGDVDGIIITGITGNGRLVLRQYVDNTADVQTAALLSVFDPEENPDQGEQYESWIYAYRSLLNRWRMFTTRSLFDIALGNSRESKGVPRLSKVAEAISTKAADTRCTFCHQTLGYDANKQRNIHLLGSAMYADAQGDDGLGAGIAPIGLGPMAGGPGGSPVQTGTKLPVSDGRMLHPSKTTQSLIGQPGVSVAGSVGMGGVEPWRKDAHGAQTRLLYTHCPRCSNRLPRCIICRMTLGTPAGQPASADDMVATTSAGMAAVDGEFSQWFSWCQTCGHGGHVSHLEDWFATHTKCPIPGCECECDKNC
ncbi:hypothetical protein EV178_001838 [Coemansia sp. RSA 1646]|nr:hypothetical protein EV178_001838 [Coemansia sp. RSA 1646]